MKALFSGFYSTPSDSLAEIWMSDTTLFVFDTNCLLNLYRCEEHTREEILSVMKVIKDRVWIPFQVGFEYQSNRRIVIEESANSLNKIKSELQKIYTQNILSSGSVKKHLYNALSDEISSLQSELQTIIDNYIAEKITPRITSKEKISQHDSIRDDIDEIINNKIGQIPTQEYIDSINEQGKKRYENKIPPGFKDDTKKESSFFSGVELQDKFGDLYLWKEIINKAKCEKIKNIIFICDDNKNDWWYIQSGKTHGALESLKTEICTESNIDNFKLINQLTFLHEARDNLKNIEISDSSLKEVEELSNREISTDDDKISLDIIKRNYKNFYKTGIAKSKEKTLKHTFSHYNERFSSSIINAQETITASQIVLSKAYDTQDDLDRLEIELSDLFGENEYIDVRYNLSRNMHKISEITTIIENLIHGIGLIDEERIIEIENNILYLKEFTSQLQDYINVAQSYISILR